MRGLLLADQQGDAIGPSHGMVRNNLVARCLRHSRIRSRRASRRSSCTRSSCWYSAPLARRRNPLSLNFANHSWRCRAPYGFLPPQAMAWLRYNAFNRPMTRVVSSVSTAVPAPQMLHRRRAVLAVIDRRQQPGPQQLGQLASIDGVALVACLQQGIFARIANYQLGHPPHQQIVQPGGMRAFFEGHSTVPRNP